MGYVWRKCQLVPQTFTEAQRQQRLRQSQLLLATLFRAEFTGCRFLPTGDEFWFFYLN
jgi:hypothetical protein